MAVEERKIYEDIARRTDGDIYIGVVGPVRTGKSTFIKRVMESLVIPNIENVYRRERARDELPQSGSGRTIMTAEPKFVPEEAVTVSMDDSAAFQVRLIDCVGYMVPGAVGQLEGETERMVTTPWFDHEIPMSEAAEVGTRKVIAEHSTIGIVVTTDGTITEIPREDYLEAEERVIRELKELGKPFLVLLNSAHPNSQRTQAIRDEIAQRHQVTCVAANCLEMEEEDVSALLKQVLYEFPLKEMDLFLPPWVDALPQEHPIKAALYEAIRQGAGQLGRIRDVEQAVASMRECEQVSQARVTSIDLGTGLACASLELPRSLFYDTISQQSGFQIGNDGDLMALLTQLAQVKASYDKVADALKEVEETGYGIVVPSIDSLVLEEPEIVRQGGRYGVRLKASAPSIHMIRADIETEVSPIVGSEKQSEEMIHYLLQEFEGDTAKIWQSNIFGKSFHELVGEDLNAKVKRMPEDAREKLRETLQRIINEGSGGLICIIL
ncbi:MAG: stage IV sporulation protein A [Flintibacter sp.]|nr:stage IV sporulation protein A [Flintibacter sp.]MCI6150826.1 stage IV sporulation protein A [Flintibacter sp.]MCI7658529.1 stage IV sporulation protein A [Flintibacter sp.]MDD7115281.1 stage IV sporulation protein A [Flintibacter sp.]